MLSFQLEMLKNILLSDGGHGGVDNETLERVRGINTTTRPRNSPMKNGQEGGVHLAPVEESVESILDVSDLSFDETQDALGESRHRLGVPDGGQHNRSKRRSSGAAGAGPVERGAKRRKSRSLGALMDANNGGSAPDNKQVLSTTTKVTVDRDGNAHAESIIEAVPVADLRKKARKSRESRGERRVTYSEQNQEFSPSAPPYEPPSSTDEEASRRARHHHHNHNHHNHQPLMTTPNHSPVVKRNFSNASNIHHRPHVWSKPSGVMRSERCGPCGKRIGFGKSRYLCRDCQAVCHLDCRENVPVPCVAAANRTPNAKAGGQGNYLADFTPVEPPMIPAILVHCFREIENRGLGEVSLNFSLTYRMLLLHWKDKSPLFSTLLETFREIV